MCERVVREIVDRLIRLFGERLEHIKLSAAYSKLLLNGAAGDPKALDDRTNCINDSDYVGPWSAIGAA